MTFKDLKDRERTKIQLGGLTRLLTAKKKLMQTMTSDEAEAELIRTYR